MSRCVVFGGGGVAGIAWLLGVVSALGAAGLDLARADEVIGTSAGSVVATQLATGTLGPAIDSQLATRTPERAVQFDAETFANLAAEAVAGSATPRDAARRMARLPLQQHDIGAGQRRAIVAARLPVTDWPEQRLTVCAVARDTGERATFRRTSGVGLLDAVTASCAVPGVWPPVEIGGRAYVDGGAHSLTNADLAAGADRTLVLVPLPPGPQQQDQLAAELAQLAPGTSSVLVADADALAAFGPNPLDPSRRADALRAGQRQGARPPRPVSPDSGRADLSSRGRNPSETICR